MEQRRSLPNVTVIPRIHLLLQFHTDAFQLSFARRHTITLRADLYGGIGEAAPLHPVSQHPARLAHNFLFFAPDIKEWPYRG